jgi:hypothetical protein
VTWGGWAGLAAVAWNLFFAWGCWREGRRLARKASDARKQIANQIPLPWEHGRQKGVLSVSGPVLVADGWAKDMNVWRLRRGGGCVGAAMLSSAAPGWWYAWADSPPGVPRTVTGLFASREKAMRFVQGRTDPKKGYGP